MADRQYQLRQLQIELREMSEAKNRLAHDNIVQHEFSEEARYMRDEAVNTLLKLDECRLVMQKMMGPNGPLRAAERHKFLPNQGEGDYSYEEPKGQQGAAPARGLGAGDSKKYLPPLQKNNTKSALLKKPPTDPKNASPAGEDEFWY